MLMFCRCTVLHTGTVSQAAGSAYMEMGNTKAMAGVYGEETRHTQCLSWGRALVGIACTLMMLQLLPPPGFNGAKVCSWCEQLSSVV